MRIKFQNLNTQLAQTSLFDIVLNITKDPVDIVLKESVQPDEVGLTFVDQGNLREAVTSISRFQKGESRQIFRFFGNSFIVPLPSFYITNYFHSSNKNPLFFKHTLSDGPISDLAIYDQNSQSVESGLFQFDGSQTIYHNLQNSFAASTGNIASLYIVEYSLGDIQKREVLKRELVYTKATNHSSYYSATDLVYFSWLENGRSRIVVRNQLSNEGVAVMLDERQGLELIDPMDVDKLESWFIGINNGFRRIQ